MKKIEINAQELNDWKRDQWNMYASESVRGRPLRLWVNCNGWFKVIYGKELLYEGTQMTHAIAAWDSV